MRSKSTVEVFVVVLVIGGVALGVRLKTEAVSSVSVVEAEVTSNTALGMRVDAAFLRRIRPPEAEIDATAADALSFIFFVNAEDCLGCGDYAAELRLLSRRFPLSNTALVATGPDREDVIEYGGRHRVRVLEDPDDFLAGQMSVERTPVFVVIGADGRVLAMDHRSGPNSRLYPVSRILADLAEGLDREGSIISMPPRGGEGASTSTKE